MSFVVPAEALPNSRLIRRKLGCQTLGRCTARIPSHPAASSCRRLARQHQNSVISRLTLPGQLQDPIWRVLPSWACKARSTFGGSAAPGSDNYSGPLIITIDATHILTSCAPHSILAFAPDLHRPTARAARRLPAALCRHQAARRSSRALNP